MKLLNVENKKTHKESTERDMLYKTKIWANNGITLIALVVTIIVLIIIAGVAISMLSGDNGILKRAGESQEKTDQANLEELVKLCITEKNMDKAQRNK